MQKFIKNIGVSRGNDADSIGAFTGFETAPKDYDLWIPTRDASYSATDIFLGQVLTDSHKPSSRLISAHQFGRNSGYTACEIEGDLVRESNFDREDADIAPYDLIRTSVVPVVPPRLLRAIRDDPRVSDYVNLAVPKLLGLGRRPKKVFVVVGVQVAKMRTEDDIVFAYQVGRLHMEPELWLEKMKSPRKIDSVKDFLGLDVDMEHRYEDDW